MKYARRTAIILEEEPVWRDVCIVDQPESNIVLLPKSRQRGAIIGNHDL